MCNRIGMKQGAVAFIFALLFFARGSVLANYVPPPPPCPGSVSYGPWECLIPGYLTNTARLTIASTNVCKNQYVPAPYAVNHAYVPGLARSWTTHTCPTNPYVPQYVTNTVTYSSWHPSYGYISPYYVTFQPSLPSSWANSGIYYYTGYVYGASTLACLPLTNIVGVYTVTVGTVISQPLTNQSACPGSTVIFSAGAVGKGPFGYLWKFGTNVIAGETNNSLILTNVSYGNAGTYSLIVTGQCSGNATNSATLTILSDEDSDYDGICDCQEYRDGTNPNDPNSVLPVLLGSWRFDTTNWAGLQGQVPLAHSNLALVTGLSLKSVSVNSNATNAGLSYTDTWGCYGNINCRRGSVRFWHKSAWNSVPGGAGPQGEARLIELGTKGSNEGWWGMSIDASGTNISFGTQTNSTGTLITNLSSTINWKSNEWHQVVLTYSLTNSTLYLDGVPVKTNGSGVANWPQASIRSQGFRIGSVKGGTNQARGRFENLETYNYVLSASEVAAGYSSPCWTALDTVLVVDASGSMATADMGVAGLTRLQAAKQACSNFIARLDFASDQGGLVHFNDSAVLTTNLIASSNGLYAAVGRIPTNGSGTHMSNALVKAQLELTSVRHNPDALPVMVFLSDGAPSDNTNLVIGAANSAKAAGTRLITVALGSGAATNLMLTLASSTNDYYYATNVSQLTNVYSLIANTLCRGTNTAPSVTIQIPTNSQAYSAPTNIPVQVSASDLENGLVKVELYGNASKLGESYHGYSNNLYSFVWTNAPVGSNLLQAVAWDEFGLSGTSAVVSIVVTSSITMSVVLTNPVSGSVFLAPATIPMSAVVSGNTSIARTEFYANGLKVGEDAVSSGNPYTFTWTGVPASGSNYVLTAKAIAVSGASATSTGVTVAVASPLSVNAGTNQVVLLNGLSATNTLLATVAGGFGSITSQWSLVVGPASVIFSSPTTTNTVVTYTNRVGNYVFQLTARDALSQASGLVTVSVVTNQPPVVDAGPNRIVAPGNVVLLNGVASDDGLPMPANLITWWSVSNKPAGAPAILFANSNAPTTVASNMTIQGVYTLVLNASDGMATNYSVMTVTVADPSSRTYTLSADFAEGELINLNYNIPNQLQLNTSTTPFPYVWVACSARGTAVRIDANTGQILGEYRTAPAEISPDPSRTTVDRYGNVWICNRGDNITMPGTSISKGSLTRIGLVIGGTRGYKTNDLGGTNFTFVAHPEGEYLQPPFKYSTAIDRDGDSLIRTSLGLGHILDWDAAQSHVDNYGGVSAALDEAIINYSRVAATGARTIAIDANNDLWVGGTGGNNEHEKVSGITGLPVPNTMFVAGRGGYGGLIDGQGVLWSASSTFRFDTTRRFNFNTTPPLVIDPNYVGESVSVGSYGMGIDPVTGDVWMSIHSGGSVVRVSPDGTQQDTFVNPLGGSAGGMAVDSRGNVWVASHHTGNHIAHFRTDGTFVGNIELGCEYGGPTGVAVDANGKIWSANYNSSTAMRYDPMRGPRMLNGKLDPNGYPLGEIDLKVSLNTAEQVTNNRPASPYNYSDMTGFVSLGATEPSGIWRVVHDSELTNRSWGIVKWTGDQPKGTRIKVEVRASESDSALTATNNLFVEVGNGEPFTNVIGRYVEIRATLSHKQGTNASPILYDLSISSGMNVVIASAADFAQDDRVTLFENSGVHVLDVLANDVAPVGTNLVITRVSPAGNGVVSVGSGATNLIYTPNTNFFGVDCFSYAVSDRQGGIGRAVVTVVVGETVPTPTVDTFPPVAADDTNIVINGNGPAQEIQVLANDFDTNAPPLTNIVITAVTQAGHGFVRSLGCKVVYTPYPGHFGADRFTYTIRNEHGWTATATVWLDIVGRPIDMVCGFITNRTFLTNNSAYSTNSSDRFAHVYRFAGDPAKAVSIDVLDANGNSLAWQIYDPQGQPVYQYPFIARSSGIHSLEVTTSPSSVGTGGITYWLTNNCSSTNLPHMAVLFGGATIPSGIGGVDFGTTKVGNPVSVGLTITNYGSANLLVYYVDPNIGGGIFTVGNTALTNGAATPITLPPGGSSNLTVRFEALQPGPTNGVLYISNDDPDYWSAYQIQLRGRANPTNTVPPAIAITGPSSNTLYASVATICDEAIAITAHATAAPGASIWGVNFYARTASGSSVPIGQDLTADGADNYSMSWGSVPVGDYRLFAVAIDNSGLQAASLEVPITVLQRATNSPQLRVLFGTNNVPSGGGIDFGVVATNVPRYVTLTLTNLGPGILTNGAIGDLSSYFYITNSLTNGFILGPAKSTNLTLVFQSDYPYGQTFDANLVLNNNDDGLWNGYSWCEWPGNYRLHLTGTSVAETNSASISVTLDKPQSASTWIYPNPIELNARVIAASGNYVQEVKFYASTTLGDIYVGSTGSTSDGTNYTLVWTNAPVGAYNLRAAAIGYDFDGDYSSAVSANVPITVLLRPASSPILQVLIAQTNVVPNHASIDYGITQVGLAVTNSLALTNSGNTNLVISKFISSNPDDFQLTSTFDLPLTPADSPLNLPPGTATNILLIYRAIAPGAATNVLTIYNTDVAQHPYEITNIARANPVNSTAPTVQLVAPTNNATVIYPSDVTLSAVAACATNATLFAVDFFTISPTGSVHVGQVLAGPALTNLTATTTWPRPAPGMYQIKAVVTDSSGLVGESTNRIITVIDPNPGSTNPPLPNLPPIVADDHLYILGCANSSNCPTYVIDVLANDSDPNGDPLTLTGFNRGTGRLGPIVQDGNRLLFFPNPLIEGTNWVSYTVSDGRGGSATGWIEIRMKMTPLPTVILVSPLDGEYIDLPARPTNLTLVVYAKAASTNLSIARVNVYRNSEITVEAEDPWDPPYETLSDRLLIGTTTVTNGAPDTYLINWPSPPAGRHRLTAYAIDSAGQENLSGAYTNGNMITSAGAVITIAGNPNNFPPLAVITNLMAGTNDVNGIPSLVYPTVTNGVIDVRGLARDDNAGDPVSYQLLLQKPDGTIVADLTPKTLVTNGFHFGTDAAGVLATNVDLTMYENGAYDIVLNVFDGWEVSSDSARILLDTQLKVGQFSFSVQDVTIPVSGIPLTVTRTYNSFNHQSGDFGYSWTYALSDMQVELDEVRERTPDLFEEDSDGGSFSLRVGGGRDVTLTLPDGQRTTFQFYFGEPVSCTGGGDGDNWCYPALWEAPPGVNYTLTSLIGNDSPGTNFYNAWPVEGWNNQPGTGFENHDFPGWVLTAQDGTRFIIRREDTGEHFYFSGSNDDYYAATYGEPYLAEIIQRDGNRIVFESDRVQHYDPMGQPTRAITFDRDDQSRIIAVRDPNSGTNGLPVLKYGYNSTNGNLVQVDKLVDRATAQYESTFYSYTNATFPHYLTGIIDPRGVKVAKTYYDESGRITAVEDADGKLTQFFHSLSNRLEVVTDRMGNTNSFVYDLRGNVLITTNAGVVTTMSYDGANRLLTQTNAFGTPQATWTLYAYDANGFQTNVITSPDHTNSFLYTAKGELLWHTDPLGNKTENRYDDSGNLTNTIQFNAQGQIIEQSFSKYVDGKLVETRNGNGVVTSSFGYDSMGNLTNTLDANGVARSFAYDANGNQTSSTYYYQGNPVTTTSIYDAAGRVTMSIDADGNTNRTVYNALGKVDRSTDRYGNTSSFLYDARGNLIQTTHADGIITRTVYDANARPILTTDRNQVTGTRTFYDEAGRVTNTVRRSNCRIDIVADTANTGQVKSVIGAEGSGLATNVTEYLASGWVKSRTDATGAKTTYDYWPDGQTKTVTDALTNITYFKYDLAGRQEYVVDALSRTNAFEYDGAGRNIKTIYANGTFTTNGFNNLGQRTVTRDQGGLLTQFAYDTSGQLTNVTKPQVPNPEASYAMQSPSWGYQYDAYGRLTVTVDPKGRGTTNAYDALGREVKRSLALGQSATNVYYTNTAARGQLWKSYDFKGQRTEYVYDNFGRVKAKYRFDVGASSPSNSVSYEYNPMGQLQQVIERYGTNAVTGYQGFAFWWPGPGGGERWLARAVRLVPAEAWGVAVGLLLLALGIWSMPVELRRRLVLEVRAGWFEVTQTLRVLWDQGKSRRLRLPSLFWRAVTLITLVCVIGTDPNFERLMNAQAACNIPTNGSTETTRITTFGYDLEGRLAQVNTPEGVINYGYDLATGRHTSTCTANSKVEYEYDVLGRLAKVKVLMRNGSDLITPEETSYTYTKVGSRETVTLPNGTVSTYRYDSLNRLTNLTHVASNSVTLASYSYMLHDTGRRTGAVEILRESDADGSGYVTNTLTWQYDGLYRLTNEVSVSSSSSLSLTNRYEYDLVGNRVKKVSGNVTTVSTFNANDHLQTEISSGGLVSTNNYVYDLNGSVVARTNITSSTSTTTYAYDLANKLKSVNGPGSVAASYQYNDSGIRVRTLSGGATNLFLVDANNHTGYAQVLEEFTAGATPTLTRSYVLGDDVLGQSGTSTATDPRWLLYDGHGSTRQLAGAGASVTRQYNYDAYGQSVTTLPTGTDPANTSSLLYCGEQYDSALEMYNLRARFYDPSNGRFNAMDTFRGNIDDPQSLHKYGYAHCDPVNGVDPSGNFTLMELMVVMTIISIVGLILSPALTRAKSRSKYKMMEAFNKDPLQFEIERGNITTNTPIDFLGVSEDEQQTIYEFWNRNGEWQRQIEIARRGNEIMAVNAAQTFFAINDTASLGLGLAGSIAEAEAAANIVYRVIRADEMPALGLAAKNPSAAYTVEGHIINGSRPNWASQYISTTRDYKVAQFWAARSGNRIVAIDLNKVNGTIIDLSTAAGRNAHLKGVTAKAFAGSSSEVLIQGRVPAKAILPFP